MVISVMWFSAAAAVLLALLFFGVYKTDKSDAGTELSSLAGVEREYERIIKSNGKCDVIYIGMSYEALHLHADNEKRIKICTIAEEKILDYCDSHGTGARVDGNNFILAATEDKAGARALAQDLAAAESFKPLHISVGVFEATCEDFRKASGYAKKAARSVGESGYLSCGAEEMKSILEKEHIEKNIEEFIKNDSFYLMFQPFTDAKTGAVVGCEALARLKSASDEEILPGKFLASVKKEKLCREFDLYMLKKCCDWAAENSGYGIFIACNFSRTTLLSKNICGDMLAVTESYGMGTDKIIIEVADERTDENFKMLVENISDIKGAGFKICLDDFGKGYTALGELSVLLPDIIGIDKSVLYGTANDRGASVFKNAVRLAGEMKAKVLCEGIETGEQARSARDAGCDILQGYYICRPISEKELGNMLKNNRKKMQKILHFDEKNNIDNYSEV